MPASDDWDAFDRDDPQESDIVGDDSADLLACPSCGKAVHEDTQQCPYCHEWIIPVDPSGRARKVIWAIAAGLVIVALALAAIL